MTRLISFIGAMAVLTLVPAQHPFIEDFQVSQISGGVFVQWTLKQGSICQGIQIERRSGQEPTYTEVGNIEGVCGNVTQNPFHF